MPQAAVMVDNCYGNLCRSGADVGADLVAGSLINPAEDYPTGDTWWKEDLIAGAAYPVDGARFGSRAKATIGTEGPVFKGCSGAGFSRIKVLCSQRIFQRLGFKVDPLPEQDRADIIQVIELGQEEFVTDFCLGVQRAGAVEWWVRPVAGDLPGYVDPVLMAAPTFIQGASLELSADAPLRHPYRVYLQGPAGQPDDCSMPQCGCAMTFRGI